jgi:hypothetical protein
MKWFMHPLLALIANATESELAKYVEYLTVENQILRDRLPRKIDTTEAERCKLIRTYETTGLKGIGRQSGRVGTVQRARMSLPARARTKCLPSPPIRTVEMKKPTFGLESRLLRLGCWLG